jgi:hypothetical protein
VEHWHHSNQTLAVTTEQFINGSERELIRTEHLPELDVRFWPPGQRQLLARSGLSDLDDKTAAFAD